MSLTPLPLAQNARKAPHSSRGKLRAAVLIGVHLLAAIHIAHYHSTGSSITPVEPSEAMQTLENGLVNAGFIFFLLTIVSTAFFGRFFCGWACHIVALQDLSTWLLKKVGWKPKPFRSRLLVFVPLFAALYMFVFPQFLRIYEGRPMPQLVYHFNTDDFWRTFPNPAITILTFFVCGFLAVVWLGNKGFCTYGCPYGAAFYYADRISPGRIRVTDACNSCGHCTAVCTSNVRVHEEVKLHKMVVDSGCLKCFDCVDACPSGALYFGFGKSAVSLSPKRIYDYTWVEEVGLTIFFLVSLYAYRGLYDQIPFLLALGLSSITAYMLMSAVKLLRSRQAKLQRIQLKSDGKFKPAGIAFAGIMLLWIGFLGHSSVVQYHTHRANGLLAQVESLVSGTGPKSTERDPLSVARASLTEFEKADLIGWYSVSENEHKMASISRYLGDIPGARKHLERATRLDPDHIAAHRELATFYVANKLWNEALPIAKRWRYLRPKDVQSGAVLTRVYIALGEVDGAKSSLGNDVGQIEILLPEVENLRKEMPQIVPQIEDLGLKSDFSARPQLAGILATSLDESGRYQEVWNLLQGKDLALKENVLLMRAGVKLKKYPEVITIGSSLLKEFPTDKELVTLWCISLIETKQFAGVLESAEKQPFSVIGAKGVQLVLYELLGRASDAQKVREILRKSHPAEFNTW